MKILLAGKDVTEAWRGDLARETSRMAESGACIFLPAEISALRLREAKSESEYTEILTDLVRRRQHIDALGFKVQRRRGWIGVPLWIVRVILWKLLRYQHDRMAFRQNQVNSNLMALLEAQGGEIAALRREVERLRAQRPN